MMKKLILRSVFMTVAVLLLIALQASLTQAKSVTPGYNYKIPQSIMTPNKVETSIGKLDFYDGLPSRATSEKVFDYLDTARGVEVFLSAIPMASIEAMRLANVKMGVKIYSLSKAKNLRRTNVCRNSTKRI